MVAFLVQVYAYLLTVWYRSFSKIRAYQGLLAYFKKNSTL